MYVQLAPGSTRMEFFYQITCVAQNLATGITSQVGAVYVCHFDTFFCHPKPY
jgi:hypothetical protein